MLISVESPMVISYCLWNITPWQIPHSEFLQAGKVPNQKLHLHNSEMLRHEVNYKKLDIIFTLPIPS